MGLEGLQVLRPATFPKGRFPQLYPVVCLGNSQLSCLRVVGTNSPAVASGQGVEPREGWSEGIRLLGGTKLHLPAVGVILR